MIYFIQSGPQGPIKIGTCKDEHLRKRISTLQTGNPNGFGVLGVMDGGAELEGDLHKRFRAHRRAGEWFAPAPEILSFIDYHSRPFALPKRQRACETPVDAAIETLGGPSKASAALGISNPSVVMNWKARGKVPANKVLDVEALTGISRHALRPDIFGPAPERAA